METVTVGQVQKNFGKVLKNIQAGKKIIVTRRGKPVAVLVSTAQMSRFVETRRPKRVLMVTECSMSDNVAADVTDVQFIRPCNLCPHMKRITLEGIRDALRDMRFEVTVHPDVVAGARRAVERMLAVP